MFGVSEEYNNSLAIRTFTLGDNGFTVSVCIEHGNEADIRSEDILSFWLICSFWKFSLV